MKHRKVTQAKRSRLPLVVVLIALAGVLSASAFGVGGVLAAPPGQTAEEGAALFEAKCVGCHTIGEGKKVGPDLEGVTERREGDWLQRWIAAPDEMKATQDPIALELAGEYGGLMPNMGLTASEVTALVAYLEAPVQPGHAVAQATLPGEPETGKNLFTGIQPFQNGAPSCRACHSIAGMGALGGGALGPDLTGAHGKFGDAMLTWPDTVPPMAAIFVDRPLTPEEKSHLLAFFSETPIAPRSPEVVGILAGLAAIGVAVLLGVASLIWRQRLRGVRRPVVAGQR